MKILLAEDEKEMSNAIAAVLKHNHFTVDAVYNGTDALDYALEGNYDGIILDIMMPGMNGIEVLTKMRGKKNTTPVLLLTAKSEIEDRIYGLDAGADDYLTKPFAMGELLARVKAITRRRKTMVPDILSLGDVTLNRSNFELKGLDGAFRLSNKEYQIMEILMEHPNQVISADQMMERIWGYESNADINVIWVYISYLRKKLTAINAHISIKAVRGLGYILEMNG